MYTHCHHGAEKRRTEEIRGMRMKRLKDRIYSFTSAKDRPLIHSTRAQEMCCCVFRGLNAAAARDDLLRNILSSLLEGIKNYQSFKLKAFDHHSPRS